MVDAARRPSREPARRELYGAEKIWRETVRPGTWFVATLVLWTAPLWGAALFEKHETALFATLEVVQAVSYLLPLIAWNRKRAFLARLEVPASAWWLLPAPPRWAWKCAAVSALISTGALVMFVALGPWGGLVIFAAVILARLLLVWRWMALNASEGGRAAFADSRRKGWLHVEATDETFDAPVEKMDADRSTIWLVEEPWVVAARFETLSALTGVPEASEVSA